MRLCKDVFTDLPCNLSLTYQNVSLKDFCSIRVDVIKYQKALEDVIVQKKSCCYLMRRKKITCRQPRPETWGGITFFNDGIGFITLFAAIEYFSHSLNNTVPSVLLVLLKAFQEAL